MGSITIFASQLMLALVLAFLFPFEGVTRSFLEAVTVPPCLPSSTYSLHPKCLPDGHSLHPRGIVNGLETQLEDIVGTVVGVVGSVVDDLLAPLTPSLPSDSSTSTSPPITTTSLSPQPSPTSSSPTSTSTTVSTRSPPSFSEIPTSTSSSTTLSSTSPTPSPTTSSSETSSTSTSTLTKSTSSLSSSTTTTTSSPSGSQSSSTTSSEPQSSTETPPATSTHTETTSTSGLTTTSSTGTTSTVSDSSTIPSITSTSTPSSESGSSSSTASSSSQSVTTTGSNTNSPSSLSSPSSSFTSTGTSTSLSSGTGTSQSVTSTSVPAPSGSSSSSDMGTSSFPSSVTGTDGGSSSSTGTGTSASLSSPTSGGGSFSGTDTGSTPTLTESASTTRSGAPVGGTGSSNPNGGLASHSNHLSIILSVLLPLLFLGLLFGALYLCRRRQLSRGMNIFGQRLELGETPHAWSRLSDSQDNAGPNREEKKTRQNTNIPISEKRSMFSIAASVVGRVGLPADIGEHPSDDFEEELDGLNGRSTALKHARKKSRPHLTLSAAKRAYMPAGRQSKTHGSSRSSKVPAPSTPPSSPWIGPEPSSPTKPSHSLLSSSPFNFYHNPSGTSSGLISQHMSETTSVTGFDLPIGASEDSSDKPNLNFGRVGYLYNDSNSDSYNPNPSGSVSVIQARTRDSDDPNNYVTLRRGENASGISRVSQDSRRTQDTQSSIETTSSLSFVSPMIRPSPVSATRSGRPEIPLVTTTFHYLPDDEDDFSSGSYHTPGQSSSPSSNNPFRTSSSLYIAQGSSDNTEQGEKELFIRSLAWRQRAAAYAESRGQRPSLMEAVEVYFGSGSNTESTPSSPAADAFR